jgi:hypothetical protein
MKHSAKKSLALLVLSGLMLLALSGAALAAPPWSDASSTWWTTNYGVTDAEVATVADGYPDGTFRPGQAVTRGQFAKMAVSGLGIDTADPAKATFVDVIPSNTMFPYVEGAYAAGLIGGYPTGGQLYFKPSTKIQRQHANTILGRYLSQLEIDITGAIHGDVGNYGSLDGWYAAEGSFYLNGFEDAKYVQSAHRATTAYLIFRGILKGSNSRLNPTATLVRAQAAALILRVKAEAEEIKTPPTAPTNLGVIATGAGVSVTYNPSTQQYLGNDPTPQVTGDTLAGRPIAIYDNGTKLVEDSSNSAGKFYTDITAALTDGSHVFTAKVKNANGLVSPASLPVTYVLDTVQPAVSIGVPTVPAGQTAAVIKALKPDFTATATDSGSGIKQVEFQFSVKQTSPVWQTISVDTVADSGNGLYTAVWPSSGSLGTGLTDGQYVFRAIATDNAGNQRISSTVDVIVDNSLPTVTITAPLPMASGIHYTESGTPTFTAIATDPAGTNQQTSGIASVQFYYAAWTQTGKPTTWSGFTLISTDTTADYAAAFSSPLPEGRYIFAVKAVDKVGNESALMNGSAYAAGVTQEVVIDKTAPVVSITAPSGQSYQENQAITITWSLTDTMPPDTVRLSYTLDGSVASPVWVDIATTTENDGVFQWTAPDITGDKTYARIRIIAVDKAGELVGNVTGHTTTALSSYFTIYDIPASVTNLTAFDTDFTAGVNGLDFQAMWTPSVSTDIISQKVYVLPAGATSLNFTSDHAVATFNDNTTTMWTGLETMTTDSRNAVLVAGSYRIWIVVTDSGGHLALMASDAFPVSDP